MAEIKIREFKTWKGLSNFIDSTFTHYNNFILRGHADKDWKLDSTITRAINKTYPKRKDINNLIQNHLTSFRLNIRGKSKINFKDISENELWAMGQHFGLYTPLLDFTKSPYVALFFALQGLSTSGKRCVWALSEFRLNEMNLKQTDKELIVEKIVPLTNDNPRLVSQQGLFLKIPLNCSLEKIIEDYEYKGKGEPFYKLIFTDDFKEDALLILQNMNINLVTLFPDLIGSALHSNYLFDIEPHIMKGRGKLWENK